MNNKIKVEIVRTTFAIILSLVLLICLIYFVSDTPIKAIEELFLGPINSKRGLGNVIEEWIPLTFAGLALALIFSSNNFNLAAEGAFFMGGLLAMILSVELNVNPIIFWIMVFLVTSFIGAITVGTPGYLKNKIGASEIVSSIMLISIIEYLGSYILMYHYKNPDSRGLTSYPFPKEYKLPVLIEGTNIHLGVIFTIIIAILIHILFSHTILGYKIRITGGNENFSKIVGVNTSFATLSTQLIGGAIACFGGAVYIFGMFDYFTATSYGYGWDGVIVATLARNNPKYVPIASLFLAYLRAGSKIMARRTDVPVEVIMITQGIIILIIVAKGIFDKYEYNLLLKSVEKGEIINEY